MIFHFNSSTIFQLATHLKKCDYLFVPNLSSYIDIESYAEKLFYKAHRVEYFENQELLAVLAFYKNIEASLCFITNISVDEKMKGKQMGQNLLNKLITYCLENNINQIQLEVRKENNKAFNFYIKNNFVLIKENIYNFELQKIILS